MAGFVLALYSAASQAFGPSTNHVKAVSGCPGSFLLNLLELLAEGVGKEERREHVQQKRRQEKSETKHNSRQRL